jgi:hypothetical protein
MMRWLTGMSHPAVETTRGLHKELDKALAADRCEREEIERALREEPARTSLKR